LAMAFCAARFGLFCVYNLFVEQCTYRRIGTDVRLGHPPNRTKAEPVCLGIDTE
jgi:hypothetical protein